MRAPALRLRCRLRRSCRLVCTAAAIWAASAGLARAQDWYPQPITAFDGRLSLSGDATATVSAEDSGYFNITDYDHGALRLIRLDGIATLRATDWLSLLVELRAEGDSAEGHWTGAPYAAYVQVRPWVNRAFELQAGRIAPAFGAFPRRAYAADNPLIGYPLAYQYLTSLRADAVPATADDLLEERGNGWLVNYPVGAGEYANGLPIATAFRFDTGVLAHGGSSRTRWEGFGSVTAGTLSNPGLDRNGAPQFSGRAVFRPVIGLVLGASAARGRFLDGGARRALGAAYRDDRDEQRTLGLDAEYSRGYWLVRTEIVASRWRIPPVSAPAIDEPLDALGWFVEGRYKVAPGVYVAGRFDSLTFSDVTGSTGTRSWDADVRRTEVGIGYSLSRNVTLKASVQHNRRDAGRRRDATLGAAQVVVWF